MTGASSAPAGQGRPTAPAAAIAFIFITVLLSIVGFGIIIPVMPELIMELTGREEAGAARLQGYLLAIYGLMQLFMSPIIGALSDRFGRRPVILASVGAYTLDFLLMALAPNFAWLFLGRALSGATSATYSAANAYVADVSPPEKRAGNFGLLGAAFGLGFIIGPFIGGTLGEMGTRMPFYGAAAVCALNFLFGLFVLPESLPAARRRPFEWRRATPLGGLKSVSRNRIVIGVLCAYFLMQMAHAALPSVWAFFGVEKFGWGPGEIGMTLAFVGLTSGIVQGGVTRIVVPRIGQERAVHLGIAAMTASFLGYAFAAPTGIFVYFWILVGAFGGFMQPGMQGIMSAATSEDEQGELQGAVASVMSICTVLSPFVMTQVFYAFTKAGTPVYAPGAPFILAAGLLGLALIPFWLTTGRDVLKRGGGAQAAE